MNKDIAYSRAQESLVNFHEVYPDNASSPISLEVIERDRFLSRLIEIESNYPNKDDAKATMEDSFSGCDAATIRKPDMNYVVVSFTPEDAEVYIAIRTYHELAHIYSMAEQDSEHPITDDMLKGDALVGFLFWKEFIADYIGLNALHHYLNRFAIDSDDAKYYIKENLHRIAKEYYLGNNSVVSGLANLIAFILNLDDYAQNRSKVRIPINRHTSSGVKARGCISSILDILQKQFETDSYMVINYDCLYSLGNLTIDTLLYLSDYADEHDW
ncbi:hypothetical protein AGMMS49992_08900 [Clostridia bacterium]|nr:hypothetical protein AGMMS49992_08900 [Clostridia bacterium]